MRASRFLKWRSLAAASARTTSELILLTALVFRAPDGNTQGLEPDQHPHLRARISQLWRRGQVGWPRRFAIAQLPNLPLLIALGGSGLAAGAHGAPHDLGRVVFTLALAVWALEEMVGGVNWFRRLLGTGAFAWIIAGLVGGLGWS